MTSLESSKNANCISHSTCPFLKWFSIWTTLLQVSIVSRCYSKFSKINLQKSFMAEMAPFRKSLLFLWKKCRGAKTNRFRIFFESSLTFNLCFSKLCLSRSPAHKYASSHWDRNVGSTAFFRGGLCMELHIAQIK